MDSSIFCLISKLAGTSGNISFGVVDDMAFWVEERPVDGELGITIV